MMRLYLLWFYYYYWLSMHYFFITFLIILMSFLLPFCPCHLNWSIIYLSDQILIFIDVRCACVRVRLCVQKILTWPLRIILPHYYVRLLYYCPPSFMPWLMHQPISAIQYHVDHSVFITVFILTWRSIIFQYWSFLSFFTPYVSLVGHN